MLNLPLDGTLSHYSFIRGNGSPYFSGSKWDDNLNIEEFGRNFHIVKFGPKKAFLFDTTEG